MLKYYIFCIFVFSNSCFGQEHLPIEFQKVIDLLPSTNVDVPPSISNHDLMCLSLNIYHEAKNQDDVGQIAVGFVTLTRVKERYWKNTVCEVVWQRRQFSWTHDGKSDVPYNLQKWESAVLIASSLLDPESNIVDPTHGSNHYYADYIDSPIWAQQYDFITKHQVHLFFCRR